MKKVLLSILCFTISMITINTNQNEKDNNCHAPAYGNC
jgi:hypothetical protein